MVLHATDPVTGLAVKVPCEQDGTLITTTDKSIDTNLIFNGAAWNDGTAITIDCNGYRAIRIWGDSTGQLDLTATNAINIGNAGFWDSFDTITGGAATAGVFSKYYPDSPRYLRLTNNTGAQIAVVNLQYARFK